MCLANAIHAANSLFKSHRIPRDIEVNHHVAELEIQAFATRIGGYKDPHITGELLKNLLSRF
jgi:hypothetical protein